MINPATLMFIGPATVLAIGLVVFPQGDPQGLYYWCGGSKGRGNDDSL